MEQTTKVKKTENINDYMNEYMKNRYKENPKKMNMYRNSLSCRKKYDIDESTWNKYRGNLHHIIHLKKMIDDLDEDTVETFLNEYKTLVFREK